MAIIVTLPPTNTITVNETTQEVTVTPSTATITVATTGITTQSFKELTDVTATAPYTAGHFVSVDENQKLVIRNTLSARENLDRPIFEYYNSSAGPNSAIVLKKTYSGTEPGTGDGTGIRFELDHDLGGFGYSDFAGGKEYATLMAVYSPTAPAFTMASSINDGSSYQNILTANKDLVTLNGDLKVNGNTIYDNDGKRAVDFTTNDAGDFTVRFDRDRAYGLMASNLVIDNRIQLNSSVLTTASTATVVLDSWNAATIRSGKYLIQISSGTDYQIWEGMMIHDGTNTRITAYGDLRTSGINLATVSAGINNTTNQAELRVTPVSSASTRFKAMKTLIYV
jgi:hypothetical protein